MNKADTLEWVAEQLEQVSAELFRIDQMEVPPRQEGEIFGEGIARALGRCGGIAANQNVRVRFVIEEIKRCTGRGKGQ